MDNKFIVCDNCGAKCSAGDTYCKKCHYTFPIVSNEPAIEGIDNEQLENYIDWHSEYYVKKFAKTKSKWFIQLNFAALLFGPTWFFFRKMYKVALIYVAILVLMPLVSILTFCTVFSADIDGYFAAKQAYNDYTETYWDTYDFGEEHSPQYIKLSKELSAAKDKLKLIYFVGSVPVFIINILFRLFGNAFYKNHIILNIDEGKGGTSAKWAIWSLVIANVVSTILSILINLIPSVFRFGEAINSLNFWI